MNRLLGIKNRIHLDKDLKFERSQKKNLNVVITGGTRGLGKSMTNEFLKKGDKVFIVSRKQSDIDMMVMDNDNLYGKAADIGNAEEFPELFDNILKAFDGEIDMFVNCAGQSGGNKQFVDHDISNLDSIVKTNLLGTILCCKHAFEIMNSQSTGGAIFNFTGAGSNGFSTPNFSLYGATKSGILQLTKTLQEELRQYPVDLHLVSPGMLFTDLLLENMNDDTYHAIKMLVTSPDLVAYHIVPRMRNTYYLAKEDNYIKFLTVMKIIYKIFSDMFNKKII